MRSRAHYRHVVLSLCSRHCRSTNTVNLNNKHDLMIATVLHFGYFVRRCISHDWRVQLPLATHQRQTVAQCCRMECTQPNSLMPSGECRFSPISVRLQSTFAFSTQSQPVFHSANWTQPFTQEVNSFNHPTLTATITTTLPQPFDLNDRRIKQR